MRQAVSGRNKTRTERTKAGLLGQGQSPTERPEMSTSYKENEFALKEPRAIIETSMAGVNDFIGLTNLKCRAPALLKGRMGNPVEHAGHISIGYTTPHLSALRVTRTASWWNIHSGLPCPWGVLTKG